MARFVFGIFVALTLLCLVPALIMLFNTLTFRSKCTATTGKVISLDTLHSMKGGRTYAPVIAFITTSGKQCTYHSDISSNPSPYLIGDEAPVYYNLSKTDEIEIGGAEAFLGAYILGAMGLVLGLAASLIYFKIIRAKRQDNQ